MRRAIAIGVCGATSAAFVGERRLRAQERGANGGGCPYEEKTKKKKSSSVGGCPYDHQGKNESATAAKVFNVYSQEINPRNQMPYNVNQLPARDQSEPLSTKRVKSSIPKGGTDSTWTYPSPQIFYNALKRKGKADDVTESDMSAVVAVHNSMNEQTWKKLLVWERHLHPDSVESLKLVRFKGRPHDLSPKARLLSTLGLRPKPFDRHDWIVTRGESSDAEVRYVIDYYYDESGTTGNTALPSTAHNAKVIHVDVRPAIDSIQSAFDRIRMIAAGGPDAVAGGMRNEEEETAATSTETVDPVRDLQVADVERETTQMRRKQAIMDMRDKMLHSCARYIQDNRECDSEESCSMTLMAVKLCMARHVCDDGAVVDRFLEGKTEGFDDVQSCLTTYEREAREVLYGGEK